MSDASARARASKRKGTSHETALFSHQIELGLDARRLAKAGSKDVGDVVVVSEHRHYVQEAKACKRLDIPQWLREAAVEADNYAAAHRVDRIIVSPMVVVKRPNLGIGRSWVIQELDWWLDDCR